MKIKTFVHSSLLLSVTVVLAGCGTQMVNLSYAPDKTKKGPLSTLKPMTVMVSVEDQRNPVERDRQGDIKNTYGMVIGKVVSKKDVGAVLADAVKSEFENNGHMVVESRDAHPDASIELQLQRYWCDIKMHFADVELLGTINATAKIQGPSADPSAATQPINTSFRKGYGAVMGGGPYAEVLNLTLKEFIRNFSSSDTILKALASSKSE